MSNHQYVRVEPEYISLREAARIYAVSTYTLRRPAGRQARRQDHPYTDRRPRQAFSGDPNDSSGGSVPTLVTRRGGRDCTTCKSPGNSRKLSCGSTPSATMSRGPV